MPIIQDSTTSTTPTTATNQAAPASVGSAMAELLTHVPAPLAEQIHNAFTDDLLFVFQVGLDAGRQNMWDALEKEGFTAKPTAAPEPHLTFVSGGA